ncbi:DUF3099 domain-containing protein [Streptacidiphilus monticola]|uniref:DUF3099 domain-containing protein n=1 Tax=Streptacidiphilus monticola TaxID=2161674 RepID=A0ABW1G4Y6_9ACTN
MAFHLHLHRHSVPRITEARTPLTEDIRHRQRRYVVTMSIRTLCVVLAIVLWQVDRVAAVVALIAGGLLPYVAVVMANAARESPPRSPDTYVKPEPEPEPDPNRQPALPPGPEAGPADWEPTPDEAAWEAEWGADGHEGPDQER